MKILVLSHSEWDDGNSFGSSFSNILGNNDSIELANIFCRTGKPNTTSCHHFFQISEKLLLKNLANKQSPSGQIIKESTTSIFAPVVSTDNHLPGTNFVKKNRWIIFFWIRDIIWFLGRWKSKELKKFITDFNPDLIFLPVYYSVYLNKIGLFIKEFSNKPMVGYISDDCYTLRQFSMNPLYWIDRFIKRKWVKKAIDECKILYVISDIQKNDYDSIFHKECKILYKGGDFAGDAPVKNKISNPVLLVYTGNIGTGRYKNLAKIGDVLEDINKNGIKAILNIYTQTPLSNAMKSALLNKKSIVFHGSVTQNLIKGIQTNADILIHAESFQLKERLEVRQSFSTKLVDYFQIARCIFAVGWEKAASIDYLIKNDAAVVARNENEIETKLTMLLEQPEMIIEYGVKGWYCGKRNHQIDIIQKMLVRDLNSLT